MKLVVGLGNPGKKFDGTRHNLGFWVVDRLRKDLGSEKFGVHKNLRPQEFVNKFVGDEARGERVVLMKNSHFINDSGMDVKKTIDHLKIPLEDVLVIHDDFDLPLGQFRLQFGRSDAGHKGVRSIVSELGSKDFWRLRIGIGHPPEGVEANDYVIAPLSPQEQEILDSLYPQILATVKDWLLKEEK